MQPTIIISRVSSLGDITLCSLPLYLAGSPLWGISHWRLAVLPTETRTTEVSTMGIIRSIPPSQGGLSGVSSAVGGCLQGFLGGQGDVRRMFAGVSWWSGRMFAGFSC